MRTALAHAGKSGRRVVSAFIATAFAQETAEAASVQWRAVADQIRAKVPKLAAIMDGEVGKRSWMDPRSPTERTRRARRHGLPQGASHQVAQHG